MNAALLFAGRFLQELSLDRRVEDGEKKRYLNKGFKMKAQPFSALILGAAVWVVSAVGLVNSVGADGAPTPKDGLPRSGAAKPKGVTDSAPDNVLEIDGGVIGPAGTRHGGKEATLRNVVDALRERYTEANIVVAPGLEKVKIADLKLRTRNLWEDLEAIRVASGAEFEWQGPGSPVFSEQGSITPSAYLLNVPAQVNPSSGLPERQGDPGSTGLFVLRPASVLPDRERNLEAFNIEPYIEWLVTKGMTSGNPPDSKADPRELAQKNRLIATDRGVQEVEQIIGESLAAMSQSPSPSREQPQFKFHNGANILIVVGTQYQLDVARKVISALPSLSGIAGQSGGVSEPRAGMSPDQADAFRRRYGLPPVGTIPADAAPGRPPQQQAQPK